MELGKAVRTRRAELRLRQRAVAEQAGISEDYLSLIERDLRVPSLELLDRLARALSVPASYLLLQAETCRQGVSEETRETVAEARSVAAELLRRIDQLQRKGGTE